ncbi:MAG: exosortase-associated EpsI family protein [Planctomycetaceae bacterium]|nr:exosortase-associated EpsI family protein [Planctomycetaceae bacterium]
MKSDAGILSRRDLLLCAGGIGMMSMGAMVDRLLNHRPGDASILAAAAQRLALVPESVGEWTSTEQTIDERECRVADITGGIRRDYVHGRIGYSVSMTLLSGSAGAMSVHPPTTCFEGVGYSLLTGPGVVTLPGAGNTTVALNRATFTRPQKTMSDMVRVFWGWSTDGHWQVPESPRLTFRNLPSLYKLYVVDRLPVDTVELPQAEVFLRDMIPVLQEILRPSNASQDSPAVSRTNHA